MSNSGTCQSVDHVTGATHVVIVASGGVVQSVLVGDPEIRVTLIDWDELDEGTVGVDFPTDPLSSICGEAREVFERVLSEADTPDIP